MTVGYPAVAQIGGDGERPKQLSKRQSLVALGFSFVGLRAFYLGFLYGPFSFLGFVVGFYFLGCL